MRNAQFKKLPVDDKMRRAAKVVNAVRMPADIYDAAYTEVYVNGRERGWSIVVMGTDRTKDCRITWSEGRNHDGMNVYVDWDPKPGHNGMVLSEAAYRAAKTFPTELQAAAEVSRILREECVV